MFDSEMEAFFNQIDREVDKFLENVGKEAVELNKKNGNYRNRTGKLRRSNYYKVKDHTLEIGNSAEYASKVSSRGYDVIDSGIQYARERVDAL